MYIVSTKVKMLHCKLVGTKYNSGKFFKELVRKATLPS